MKLGKNISQAQKDRLFWSICVDFNTDKFVPTSKGGVCDNFHSILEHADSYTEFIEFYSGDMVMEYYRESFRKVMSPQNILACLRRGIFCSLNYGMMTTHGNQRRMMITAFSADGDPDSGKCTITATSVDNEYNILQELEVQENKNRLTDARLEAQNMMLQSLNKMFFSVTLIDLEQDRYQEVISGDGVHALIQDEPDAQDSLFIRLNTFVSDMDKSYMSDFLTLSNLPGRLEDKDSVSAEFYSTSDHWMQASFLTVKRDEAGGAAMVLFITEIIDDEKEAQLKHQNSLKNALEDAVRMAETDAMTSLYNRCSGEKYVNGYLEDGSHGMLCLFDIDAFKHFNDTYGHAAGDKVIKGVAACLRKTFRSDDVLIRAGGDEFVMFAVGIRDKAVGERKLQELAERVAAMTFEEFTEKVSLSIGTVYTAEHPDLHFKELFKLADALMYEVKQKKKIKRG